MTAPDPVVIVGAARTPMGGFQGALKDVPAPGLGGAAIRAAFCAMPRCTRSAPEHPKSVAG